MKRLDLYRPKEYRLWTSMPDADNLKIHLEILGYKPARVVAVQIDRKGVSNNQKAFIFLLYETLKALEMQAFNASFHGKFGKEFKDKIEEDKHVEGK